MAVDWRGEQLYGLVREAAMRGIVRGTERVLGRAVRAIAAGAKSGHVYTRRGIVHQASAPGEAPATDTGRLAQSGRTTYDRDNLVGTVTFSTLYAEPLELGTERMEPRPYLRPALSDSLNEIRGDVADEIRGVLGT